MNKRSGMVVLLVLFVLAGGPLWAESLMMATTTSTDNTGLLDFLAPTFEEDTGIELKWTATGTGKALQLGRSCDVDVLLVHAPHAEKAFVAEGYGTARTEIMYNDFVIIGPASDPACLKGRAVGEALSAVAGEKAGFISRGDDSGTHKKEQALWMAAGMEVPDKDSWYLQPGQGMMATITMAEERSAYTMTDRGTYIKYESVKGGDAPLKILVEGDDVLLNQYSVIPVSPENCPGVRHDLAVAFAGWMASERAQKLIGEFKLLGKQLFTPNAT
ncbi:MAG: substrate-binding domain-containing protein [Desulfohalobiaceae bacterium]